MTNQTQSPDSNQGAQPPARKGMSTGCQVALGCLGVIAILIIIVVVIFANAISWVNNGRETAAAPYSAPQLTFQQQMDVGKIHADQIKAYETKTDWDLTLTPELFNAFVNGEIKRKKANGTFKKTDAEGAEVRFEGQDTVFRLSVPDQEKGGFFNMEVRGDPHIENGKFLGRIDSVKLANREAPWLARLFVDMAVDAARKGEMKNTKGPNQEENPLEAFKLMRREGEKIHIIVEGSKVPKPDDQ